MPDPAVTFRFSASAARYDAHAHAQRLSGRDLLAWTVASLPPRWRDAAPAGEGGPGGGRVPSGALPSGKVRSPARGRAMRILEPGCGTGLYTRMLLDAFPAASVVGVDISEAMTRVARRRLGDPRVRFVVADAEEIAAGSYDLITSNATFQWFLSFPRTVARMASLLARGGTLTFSFFGPGTYAELDGALQEAAAGGGEAGGARVAAAGFLGRDGIADVLSAVFPRWDISERRYHQDFPTLADLLRSIRYTGTRGGGARRGWSPGLLARVEEAYRRRHGGIRATYQVLLCRGHAEGEPCG